MDSQVKLDWYRALAIDNRWRQEKLSTGEADVPMGDLPELDSGDQIPSLTPKPPEQKWSDTALTSILNLAQYNNNRLLKSVTSCQNYDLTDIDMNASPGKTTRFSALLQNSNTTTTLAEKRKDRESGTSIYFDAPEFDENDPNIKPLLKDFNEEKSMIPDRSECETEIISIPLVRTKSKGKKKKKCCRCWRSCCKKKKKGAMSSNSTKSENGESTNGYGLVRDESSESLIVLLPNCLKPKTESLNLEEIERGDDPQEQVVAAIHPRGVPRRTRIPDRPNISANLWSIIKNAIGRDLSKYAMPVSFSEPLSMLQRLTEDYEYSGILDQARKCKDPCEQMCYVVAFTVSSYASTAIRTGKPFNPLLGETFECDRRDDLGWRCISEQVSHHPPSAALYCQGNGWECWQEFTMESKVRGNYIEIVPLGIAHLQFADGNHYTWRKVKTVVHNLMIGSLWIENVGEMVITNHTNGDTCQLKYIPYSVFNRKQKEVVGSVIDSDGFVQWHVNGTWDGKLDAWKRKVAKKVESKMSQKTSNEVSTGIPIWTRRLPPPESEKYYNLTEFACQLNEMEEGVAPTDCRLRPDQRLMEEGDWDKANEEKLRLEEKQRQAKKKLDDEERNYSPVWFRKEKDPIEGSHIHVYKGEYWGCKKNADWSRCPDIF